MPSTLQTPMPATMPKHVACDVATGRSFRSVTSYKWRDMGSLEMVENKCVCLGLVISYRLFHPNCQSLLKLGRGTTKRHGAFFQKNGSNGVFGDETICEKSWGCRKCWPIPFNGTCFFGGDHTWCIFDGNSQGFPLFKIAATKIHT